MKFSIIRTSERTAQPHPKAVKEIRRLGTSAPFDDWTIEIPTNAALLKLADENAIIISRQSDILIDAGCPTHRIEIHDDRRE
jgi:hypothetical protein